MDPSYSNYYQSYAGTTPTYQTANMYAGTAPASNLASVPPVSTNHGVDEVPAGYYAAPAAASQQAMMGSSDNVYASVPQGMYGGYAGHAADQGAAMVPPADYQTLQQATHLSAAATAPYAASPAASPLPTADLAAAPAASNTVDANGLRWTWSTYPNTAKVKAKEHGTVASLPLPEMIVPLACMYAPLHPIGDTNVVLGDPGAPGQQCTTCGAYWNVHSSREDGKYWVCLSCLRRNALPANYSPQHPALLCETVEYILPGTRATQDGILNERNLNPQMMRQLQEAQDLRHPVFIFVVDVCLASEEVDAVRHNLLRCLPWLPSRSLVGFITFGAQTTVWELGSYGLTKNYMLRGEKAYTVAELGLMLQVSEHQPVRGRFLVPLEECEFALTTLLEDLQADGAVFPADKRPLRTTGTAVAAATFLLETLHSKPAAKPAARTPSAAAVGGSHTKVGKILLLTGGPCTRGPGTIVSTDKAQMMRFHRDIIGGDTPYYSAAFDFYNALEARLTAVNGCLDVFAQSFDQTGVMEMRNCVNNTGGTFLCGDAFSHEIFATSWQQYFARCDLRPAGPEDVADSTKQSQFVSNSGFGVHLEVHTSADTLVSGILGPCNVDVAANTSKLHRSASPVQIGVGGTTRWCVSAIDHGVTLAVLFDTATLTANDAKQQSSGSSQRAGYRASRFVQFVTRFNTPTGEHHVRVTSVVQPVAPVAASMSYYTSGQAFDQTCASTVIARMAVSILERFPNKWDDAKRWLDTLLVRFVRRYASFTPGHAESLRLDPCLALFPSFMFNLRRSEYFMVLNISPDETTFKRHWLMREPVDTCVLMIQPTLDSYDLEHPYATAVPLDSSSLRHDNIVLMDAFFNVHVMWGSTIFEWIKANYQENPEYAYFAELLEVAEADAQAILAQRYPYPRFSRTDADGSEARHVKTRVNPASTYQDAPSTQPYNAYGQPAATAPDLSDMIYTDDASIMKFMSSLKQAVVMVDAKEKGKPAVLGN